MERVFGGEAMKQMVKRAIAGSVLETFVHGARARISGGAAWKGFVYDQETFRVMDRCIDKQANCVDVGAHQGDILIEILRRAPDGRHLAVEPIPHFARLLEERFAGNANVMIIDAALSDELGTTTFNLVVSNPAYSGIKRRRFDRPDEVVEEIEVRLVRLDDLVDPSTKISFVKIDVEGAEVQVLRGAKQLLKRNKPVVVFEHGLGGADVYGTGPDDVWAVLVQDSALRISTMKRWLADDSPLSREEFRQAFRNGQDYYFMAYP